MLKIFLPLIVFFTITTNSISQTITITGPSTVSLGAQETYQASFDYSLNPYTNLTWTVTGGTIISQMINPTMQNIYCEVQWDNTPGTGSISLYEDLSNGYCELPIQIGGTETEITCSIANAGNDVTLCSGGAQIGTAALPGYTYSWSPISGLDNSNIAQPFANPATTTVYTLTMTPQQNNLIQNGDFENNLNGFSTDYGIFPNGDLTCSSTGPWGSIGVTTTPILFKPQWCNVPDHSPIGDKMLIVDGSCGANRRVWFSNITVTAGKTYYFSSWVMCLTRALTVGDALPRLRLLINGVTIVQNFTIPYADCSWIQFSASWVSNATTALIEIIDDAQEANSNDFCLDDLFFSECPVTTDNVNVIISPNRSTVTPAGPIDYYTETDNTPSGFTLTSSQAVGNQWYKDGQIIPGATNQSLFTGNAGNMGSSYYVEANGCQSNPVTVNYHNFGYGFFGEEHPYFGAVVFPFQSPQYYCKNTTNNFIRNFDLGTGATYTWNFSPWGNTPYSSLTPSTYNPSSYSASINVGNNPYAWDQTYIQGIADLNGHQKIVDYNLIITSQTPVENRSFCGSQQYQIINQTGNNFTDRKAGESGFDWEHYEFGPNCTIISPSNLAGTGPISFTLPGKTPLSQPLKVQFSGSSYIRTYCYYNWGGCYRKEVNVSLAACRSSEIANNEVSIYPNPATSQITITSKHNITQVEIYHSFSPFINKRIKTNQTNTISINTNDLKAGIYICKIITVNGTEYQKLLIEK